MPVTAPPPLPLAIDRVERSRAKRDQVRLRLIGHWVSSSEGWTAAGSEALLVVQLHGQRHRFASTRDDPRDEPGLEFTASFTIPDWAVPEQPGQAVLWVGDDVVAVPPPGASIRPAESPVSAGEGFAVEGQARADTPATADRVPSDPHHTGGEGGAGRAGPLAELLFKETVTALRAELEQRTAEAAQLRARLAEAQRESESRGGVESGLESAHAELRGELRRLMEAVGEQRREFDEQLAAAGAEADGVREELDRAHGERDTAREELDRARSELAPVRDELEQARSELAPVRDELEQARSELSDVRAELEGSRAELDQARVDRDAAREEVESRLASERAEFDQQLAAARAEGEAALGAVRHDAEAETDAARQETETMLAAVRGESDSRAQAAEAQARELEARLRERTAGERRRAEEAAALREQLAASHVARDAALGEVGGLRAELERLGGELAVARERGGGAGDELTEAQQLLADARALTERLRGESSV
jgi:chromosome segregation ATPase